MIDLSIPMNEREPLDVVELTFYQQRLADDAVAKALVKIEATAVELMALDEEATGPTKLRTVAASQSLLEAHGELVYLAKNIEAIIKGLASYMDFNEVEWFDSMKELYLAQKVFQELKQEEAAS